MGIYCNDGFALSEMLIERVSGQKYIDFLTERIFRPLGMDHTGESVGMSGGRVDEFYDPDGKKYPREVVCLRRSRTCAVLPTVSCPAEGKYYRLFLWRKY